MKFPFICACCKRPLEEPGALVLSPPDDADSYSTAIVTKYHICVSCFEKLEVAFV